jgi:hypothetical protein
MSIAGYVDYKSREFCRDVKCPVQLQLEAQKNSEGYEKVREKCRKDCRYTAWQFHHWLIERGYLVVRKSNENEK